MERVNLAAMRDRLAGFDFKTLFIEELGWSQPKATRPEAVDVDGAAYTLREIAELSGVRVFEVESPGGGVPDTKEARLTVHRRARDISREHLLIFVDQARSQSLWQWVKDDDGKDQERLHSFYKGQSGDLLVGKLAAMFVDISVMDADGHVALVEVIERLRKALDVETVTKQFYTAYRDQRLSFIDAIQGIDSPRDREWYASVLLNRLMFVYFLQFKGFLNQGQTTYLQDHLAASQAAGGDGFYRDFLLPLFFEGLANPTPTAAAQALLGRIPYLNGGLFLRHPIEERWADIRIPDAAFQAVLGLFKAYSWNLDDRPGGDDGEINPDVLGYIFEKYINQKAFGAYYTRPEITTYLCQQTIHRVILDQVNAPASQGLSARRYESIDDLLRHLDADVCRRLLDDILPRLSILDPACGSGAFLVAAMKTLLEVYGAVIGRIDFLKDGQLRAWKDQARREHPSLHYFIRKRIITDNLYGVDIMEEAVEIARLRLFLALVATADRVDQLEPLPNIDFNILPGNSLIGLLRVRGERESQLRLTGKTYTQTVDEKNRLVAAYKDARQFHAPDALLELRHAIDTQRADANAALDDLLLDDFAALKIRFEQATWDDAAGKEGRPIKRGVSLADVQALRPFHWGFEFDAILNARGGFDVILTNPPWEVFQTDDKEFFQTELPHLSIQKNKLRIEDWLRRKATLMQDSSIREAWLSYASEFAHVSRFIKAGQAYKTQTTGKINLYAVFLEQAYNLLRDGGQCGIVIPSGIYTDLGAKGLRELLFDHTTVSGLFGFENRREIFEGVDSRFKFVVLTFARGGRTEQFPAAFMRHDVAELAHFPRVGALDVSVDLIRRLSPDSLSLMELKSERDVTIAEKMLRFPLLGERIDGAWNIQLTQEFNMTTDSGLFHTAPAPGRLPLYEGKLIHQFDAHFSEPRYWVDERAGRQALLGKRQADVGQTLDYQHYRLGFRDVARNTDERTMIAAVLPSHVFAGNTLNLAKSLHPNEALALVALLNSFVADYMIRQKVTAHCNMFYVYQLPIPRLTEADAAFRPIVERAARLVCVAPEFDALARAVGVERGATDGERARLRAELDGLVAHLYGLTEEEFRHILATFPLVAPTVKDAALQAYLDIAAERAPLALAEAEARALIEAGESKTVEFKATARWNVREGKADKAMEKIIVKTVAAFLNSDGGTLLIGVRDDGSAAGLAPDLATLGKRPDLDGYQQFLVHLFRNAWDHHLAANIDIDFPTVRGVPIARVTVRPAPDAVWLKVDGQDRFYIRDGNTSQELSPPEAARYISRHRTG